MARFGIGDGVAVTALVEVWVCTEVVMVRFRVGEPIVLV